MQTFQNDTHYFSVTASADLSATPLGTRMKITSSGAAIAGAAEQAAGYLATHGVAGATVSLRSVNAPSQSVVASKAIAVGARVYGAASGKVTDASSTAIPLIGVAITAASADGDSLTVVPVEQQLAS